MLKFDTYQEPPTTDQLDAERQEIKDKRHRLKKFKAILHAVIVFFCLVGLSAIFDASAGLVAAIDTGVAAAVSVVILCIAVVVGFGFVMVFGLGVAVVTVAAIGVGIAAGVVAGIAAGVTVGVAVRWIISIDNRLFDVVDQLANLRYIDDPNALRLTGKVLAACKKHPDCEAYRQAVAHQDRALTVAEAKRLIERPRQAVREQELRDRQLQLQKTAARLRSKESLDVVAGTN